MTETLEQTYTIEQTNEMFRALIMELDLQMGELMTKRSNGDWVKTADAMDVLVDFRNSLSGMIFD
jgi:hypothetical protein